MNVHPLAGRLRSAALPYTDSSLRQFYFPVTGPDVHNREQSMDAIQLRRAMRTSIAEGALATTMGSLVTGATITGFALALGATPVLIGLLVSLPMLANCAQLAGAYLLETRRRRKQQCVIALWIGRLVWLPLIVAAFFAGPEHQWALLVALLVVTAISNVCFAIGGVAWLSWIKDLIPARERIGFLALRNQCDTMLSLAVGIGAAVLIDWFAASSPASISGFTLVLALGIGFGLLGMPMLNSIPDAGLSKTPEPFCATHLVSVPLADGHFRRILAFGGCWNFAAHLATPFFVVVMLQRLSLVFWQVSALLALGSLAGLLASRFWSRLSVRFGVKPVLMVATFGDALFPLAWLFVTPGGEWLLLPIYLMGAFGSPVAVGSANLLMRLSPNRGVSSYFALYNVLIGLAVAAAATFGGCIAGLESLPGLPFSDAGIGSAMKLLFLLSCVGRLLSIVLLARVEEPQAEPLWRTVLNKVAPQARGPSRVPSS